MGKKLPAHEVMLTEIEGLYGHIEKLYGAKSPYPEEIKRQQQSILGDLSVVFGLFTQILIPEEHLPGVIERLVKLQGPTPRSAKHTLHVDNLIECLKDDLP